VLKNEVRIIAGIFRSRKIQFPVLEGLRPTPDRVKETLFNWLRHDLEGARCLDLFSGSGSLGFEAASRGAQSVVQIDANRDVISALKASKERLKAECVDVIKANVSAYLSGPPEVFDLVFMDPPFRKNEVIQALAALEKGGWLSPRAKIYVECEHELALLQDVPASWVLWRKGCSGDVAYYLFERQMN